MPSARVAYDGSQEAGRLVGAPVVGIAPQVESLAVVTCPRCHGDNSAKMGFCQFCGTQLARPTSSPPRPASAKAPPARDPRLVVIAQDGTRGREYPLHSDQIDIGRLEGAIRLPNDPYVSPRHARITQRNGRFFLMDLGSMNGVYVSVRQPEPLRHSDLVLVGLEVLRFEVVSDAERGLGPATENGTQVFGSPASPRYARLCQRTVEGVTRDVFYLTRTETVIGRESGDIVFTTDPFMSRRHASVRREPGDSGFVLKDLGSSNGTYLAIRSEVELSVGDQIRIGQHLFRMDEVQGGHG